MDVRATRCIVSLRVPPDVVRPVRCVLPRPLGLVSEAGVERSQGGPWLAVSLVAPSAWLERRNGVPRTRAPSLGLALLGGGLVLEALGLVTGLLWLHEPGFHWPFSAGALAGSPDDGHGVVDVPCAPHPDHDPRPRFREA